MLLKKKAETVMTLFCKYREPIMYFIFGSLTTFVSASTYFMLSWIVGLSAWLSSVISWFFAVSFAFVTNKIFVFQYRSKAKLGTATEATLFFAMRLSSLGLNIAIMLIFVDLLKWHEPLIFALSQVIILTFNYTASKYLVFKEEIK